MHISSYKIITNNNLYNILLLFLLKICIFPTYLCLIYLYLNLYLHTYLQNYRKKNQMYKYLFLASYNRQKR